MIHGRIGRYGFPVFCHSTTAKQGPATMVCVCVRVRVGVKVRVRVRCVCVWSFEFRKTRVPIGVPLLQLHQSMKTILCFVPIGVPLLQLHQSMKTIVCFVPIGVRLACVSCPVVVRFYRVRSFLIGSFLCRLSCSAFWVSCFCISVFYLWG